MPRSGSVVHAPQTMEYSEKTTETEPTADPRKRLSLVKCFDDLYFCYSPVYQMKQYYRTGFLDNCLTKWDALIDCFVLKTKKPDQLQEILDTRDKAKSHIWTFRSVEEASTHWEDLFQDQEEAWKELSEELSKEDMSEQFNTVT